MTPMHVILAQVLGVVVVIGGARLFEYWVTRPSRTLSESDDDSFDDILDFDGVQRRGRVEVDDQALAIDKVNYIENYKPERSCWVSFGGDPEGIRALLCALKKGRAVRVVTEDFTDDILGPFDVYRATPTRIEARPGSIEWGGTPR